MYIDEKGQLSSQPNMQARVTAAKAAGFTEEDIYRRMALKSPAPAVAGKKSGGFEVADLLPWAGGIAGSFIPGVGPILGAGIGGTLATGAKQLFKGEGFNPGEMVTEGALSMFGGGMAKGISKVAGVTGTKLTKDLPKRMMENTFKEPLKDTRSAIKGGKSLGEEALERGTKGGSDESIYKGAVGKINQYEDELQARIANSKRSIPITEIDESVAPLIKRYADAGDTAAVSNITNRIDALKNRHGKMVPVSVANEVKRTLYDEARGGYGKLSSSHIEGVKSVARSLKEGVAKRVPGADDINKELSFNGKLADSLIDKMARGGRNNLLGLDDLMIGGQGFAVAGPAGLAPVAAKKILGSTAGKTYIAPGLNKLGNLGIDMKGIPSKTIGQTAARLPSIVTGSMATQAEDPEATGEYLPDIEEVSAEVEEAPVKELFSKEDAFKAMQDDWAATGGKNITKIQSMYETFKADKATKEKPLSAEKQKMVIKAGAAMSAVERIAEDLQKDPSVLWKKFNPLDQSGRSLDADMASAIDVLGYFRTGATITPDQRKDYYKIFPSGLDDPNTIRRKLAAIMAEFKGYSKLTPDPVPEFTGSLDTLPEIGGSNGY